MMKVQKQPLAGAIGGLHAVVFKSLKAVRTLPPSLRTTNSTCSTPSDFRKQSWAELSEDLLTDSEPGHATQQTSMYYALYTYVTYVDY